MCEWEYLRMFTAPVAKHWLTMMCIFTGQCAVDTLFLLNIKNLQNKVRSDTVTAADLRFTRF